MKTIKVRIAVVGNAKTGDYAAAAGMARCPEPDMLVEYARAQHAEGEDENVFVSWVEAEVPVPEAMQYRDVTAKVVAKIAGKGEQFKDANGDPIEIAPGTVMVPVLEADEENQDLLVSTRSNENVDARRDFDGFEIETELERLRLGLRSGNLDFIREAFGNIDEWLSREGRFPVEWEKRDG